MATEAKPTTATLSMTNLVTQSIASIGNPTSEQTYHRAVNLTSPLRGIPWRFTGGGGGSVDIDLGVSVSPGVAGGIREFALVNYNGFPGGLTVTLQAISGIGGSVVSTFSYVNYLPASVNRVVRWFVGNSDAGTLAAASRYYRVTLPAGFAIGGDYPRSVDSFTQVGVIWLGDWTEIGYDKGARIQLIDPSIETKSREGAAYYDALRKYHEIELKVPLVPASILYPTLKETLDIAGGTTRMLLDMHSAETADYWRAHGAYYGRLDLKGGSEQDLSFSLYGDLKLKFNEDPA